MRDVTLKTACTGDCHLCGRSSLKWEEAVLGATEVLGPQRKWFPPAQPWIRKPALGGQVARAEGTGEGPTSLLRWFMPDYLPSPGWAWARRLRSA